MAEEEVVAAGAASPVPAEHKRKLEDLEPDAPEPQNPGGEEPLDSSADPDAAEGTDLVPSDETEAKRPRLDEKPDGIVNENGHQVKVDDNHVKDNALQPEPVEDAEPASEDVANKVNDEQPTVGDSEAGDAQNPSVDTSEVEKAEEPSKEETQQPSAEAAQQGDDYSAEQEQPISGTETVTHRMEVPNNKVGVLIGKAGDTIRYLQYNTGAKIQITRDADADPYAATRPVEIIGSLENIQKAEKLINAVIAEADAGGSPSLVARGLGSSEVAAAAEHIQIQVPNEKVGLIIGRGGETIKSLQTRSGARIQLIPQHPPEGDDCKERTVRVTGDKRQIEVAREMIKEVMNQTVRPSPLSSGFDQQANQSRGPSGPPQWGPRGPYPSQSGVYDYPQRGGPYPSHNSQYSHASYGNYPPQMGPRSNFNSGWEQRPSHNMQGPPPHSGGYDYYGGRGHLSGGPMSARSNPAHVHGPGPSPAPGMGPPTTQPNYNYTQQQGPYSQAAPQQGYGHHGYDSQAPMQQNPYGSHGSSQSGSSQPASQPGYAGQNQYDKPQSYAIPAQGPPQSYSTPRGSQPGEMPYQGSVPAQSYGSNVPPQQTYPYASDGPTQQAYPQYGSALAADGYSQQPPVSGTGYPQQGSQPGYGQPVAQQAPGYAQVGAPTGYGQYPASQQGYPEQLAPNTGYGYGPQDPVYSGGPGSAYTAPPSGQPGYSQQAAAAQPTYDLTVPQSGAYGSVPAPVGYGKTVSTQPGYPQYDATQMYAAPR